MSDGEKLALVGVGGAAVIAAVIWYLKRRAAAADPLNPAVLKYEWPMLSRSSSPDKVFG